MPFRLFLALLALTSLAAAGSFDKPLRKQIVPLSKPAHAKVSCYFFADFMVKEVDLREKGAESLSIIPITKGKTPICSRKQAAGELVINPQEWTGYFQGVKDHFVFFSADDGVNGGMGFAVFESATARKVYDDVAFGPITFAAPQNFAPTLRYQRVVDSECKFWKEPACWERIKSKTGISGAEPDCKAAYEKSARALAKGRCDAQKKAAPDCMARELKLATEQTSQASSVIVYPVEVNLSAEPSPRAVAGPTQCRPSD